MRRFLLALMLVVFTLSFYGCSKTEETPNNKENVAKYEVSNVKDISIGSQMFSYNIIVNHEASKQEIETYAKEILEKAKAENPFKSIQMLFYDGKYSEGLETVPPLGKYIFAPEGDFSKGNIVNAGEYDKMTVNNQIKDVNWKLRPSENDIKIVEAYNQFLKDESDKRPDDIIKDTEVKENLAKYMELKVDDINKALTNVDKWIWQE